MAAPSNVAEFHADYDEHPDDRIRLFGAVADTVPRGARVLYPGSYVDIAPSIWFDDVTYVDTDERAARFFDHADAVAQLIDTKRRTVDMPTENGDVRVPPPRRPNTPARNRRIVRPPRLALRRIRLRTPFRSGRRDQLGFDEPTNFVEFFRRETDLTPAQFRRSPLTPTR